MTPINHDHVQPERLGVLLANLGTPNAPTRRDVRRYLAEFLWDPRVVEMSRPAWWLVLNLIILNTRPARSARAYAKVWSDQGSPLLAISRRQQGALEAELNADLGDRLVVKLGMRYGEPSLGQALDELSAAGARRILVLPLYPQYSATTVASIFDGIAQVMRHTRWLPELRFINHYHDHPAYIAALADSVRRFWTEHGRAERLLMSFHGIPKDYFDKGDPYFCECHKTGRLLAEALELTSDQWQLSFQSRLGPKQWLTPYTDHTLETMARNGVRSVQVICPGFSADCLETLEEIAMENRDLFLEAGGEQYHYIPALNDQPGHIEMLKQLVLCQLQGWLEQPLPDTEALALRARRATELEASGVLEL